ncbi:hypothetical protein JX265_011740 [Neoarthrinium moseri]|uniref:Uncharacterized protein n=1 Tax=Neoarthrinium moseri TaxID=1658444 RepID=A0A9P9WC07_9PEZI|nr:uncharacterized protein JN550_002042 [Neoarthrinium moseri]KAI1848214.1 hypothetical protein JX266_005927 [Neoarthrinium moseri]KAI1856228.1 hypothetical protein JX265_011740 [Neoarthrinium moseri]KAI1875756.1 hypothetical protein JN550_002042 [Neoarthrinium moseri]
MHHKLALATLVATAALANAVPDRPRIYFPRAVKRQLTNVNHTITAAPVPSESSSTASSTESTKRDPFSLSDFFNSLSSGRNGDTDTVGSDSTADSGSAVGTGDSAPIIVVPTLGLGDSSTTTDASTTTASDGTPAVDTDTPPLIALPTLGLGDTTTTTSAVASDATNGANSTATETGATTTAAEVTTTEATATATDAVSSTGIEILPTVTSSEGGGLGGVISTVLGVTSVLPGETNSTTTDITATQTGTDVTSATSAASESIPITTTDAVSVTATGDSPVPTTTSDGGLGGVISTVLGVTSVLSPETNTTVLPSTTAEETGAVPTTTASATESVDTNSGLLPTLTDILTSILDPTTTFPGTAPTASGSTIVDPTTTFPGTAPTTSASAGISDIITSLLPIVTPTTSSASVSVTAPPVDNGTESGSTTSLPPTVTGSVPITINTTTPDVSQSTAPTTLPTTISNTTVPEPTLSSSEAPTIPTTLPTTIANSTVPTTSSASQTESETTIAPTTTSDTVIVTSIPVTATITNSESWLPGTIIMQTSTSASTTASTTSTGIPTTLPKAITPFDTPPSQPPNTTPIQISFNYGLNYQFIAQNGMAAAQLFSLVPQAVAFDRGFSTDDVVMRSIVPYDTTAQLGYITSQAILYVPSANDTVRKIQLDHKIPSSPLYTNPNQLVFNMTSQINVAIDIIMGSTLEGSKTTATDGASPTSTNNNDPFGGGSDNQTSSQKGTTAAIAVGSAAVAAAYGAAMFLIARRFKRKRQAASTHQRSSSITSPSDMRQTGSPALMGGALLSRDFTAAGYGGTGGMRDSQGSGTHNSARTAFISAPVRTENSLGWT